MAAKPRVLFILRCLWGDNGITTHLSVLAQGLIAQGWEVALASELATGSHAAQEEAMRAIKRLESFGVQYFPLSLPVPRLSFTTLATALQSLWKLNQVIDQFNPDIIHIHSLSVCPYIQIIGLLHRISFVSTCHLEPTDNRLYSKLGALISTLFKMTPFKTILGNRVIAISRNLQDFFEKQLKIPKENIRLIYHGVDPTYFRVPSSIERLRARHFLNILAESKVICHIGRLSSVKGHDVLIQALSHLRAEGLDVIALCAGKGYGEEEEVLQQLAAQAQVSDLIHLLGLVDARQVLWASDVITLPSRREAFPLVIPEAMLCGVVPIRTPASGAFDQIENGANGFIVPFDDPQALASRIKQLLENVPLRTQLSSTAIETASLKFTSDRMIKETIDVYQELLK